VAGTNARFRADKATQGDMTAAKEVFDRIDGKTPTAAPASALKLRKGCPRSDPRLRAAQDVRAVSRSA
jgi:hypothetical protein